MASGVLSLQEIYEYLKENDGKVRNKEAVRHFKKYLTDPLYKGENRIKFKEYINKLAHTKHEGDEKVLILKTKYSQSSNPSLVLLGTSSSNTSSSSLNTTAPQYDPRNSIGIPTSPINTGNYDPYVATLSPATPPRQPPPYRNPPPVVSPSPSLDSISLSSNSTLDDRPQAPPRRRGNLEEHRSNSRGQLIENRSNAIEVGGNAMEVGSNTVESEGNKENEEEKEIVSVKERTQKFNRMASVEDELSSSPRVLKSAEKDRSKNWGAEEIETANLPPLEQKKCQEWYVTASRGDYQELLKLARDEPRLVNKKDPFMTVLHWGAKHGNAEIIKAFAGRYKVNVNGLTNGGYTPLHISAQFGHKHIFKLLIEVYKADTKIRDYSGRTAEYYLLSKEQKENNAVTLRKIKGRKKQSEKDLGFLRIGSLNVRVKKTTEAFSNFLGVGNSGSINPTDTMTEKVHKGWGSADNVNKDSVMAAPKGYVTRKKSKRGSESGMSSTPSTPRTPVKNYSTTSLPLTGQTNDSDSDCAAGFDSNWKS